MDPSKPSNSRRDRRKPNSDNSDLGKEKEHDFRSSNRDRERERVRVRETERTLELNIDRDEDDNDSEGGVGILNQNLTSASSALQGLLRKLGAGLDDLLPSPGMGVAGLGHLFLSRCLHGLIMKYGQIANVIVGTALLNAYARCRDCRSSYRAFRELKNPGLVSCNAMISAFVLNDPLEEAFALFNQFRKSGLAPGVTTTVSLVGTCSNLQERKLCESVHGLSVKVGLLLDASVINSLLSAYSSFWDVNHARRLFEKMECKDVISWSTMMSIYIRFGDAMEVLKLFNEPRREDVSFDDGVIINLISACGLLADFGRGRQAHAHVIVSEYYSDIPVMNSIISMYSRCRQLDYSRVVFDRVAKKSVVSWSAIISGCAQNGRL